jgi:hypothetical protein
MQILLFIKFIFLFANEPYMKSLKYTQRINHSIQIIYKNTRTHFNLTNIKFDDEYM